MESMKQLVLDFLQEVVELPIALDERTEAELLRLMATAIAAVQERRVERRDEPSAQREQDCP